MKGRQGDEETSQNGKQERKETYNNDYGIVKTLLLFCLLFVATITFTLYHHCFYIASITSKTRRKGYYDQSLNLVT